MYFDIMGALRKKAARAEAEDLIDRHGATAWSIAEDRAATAGEFGEHQRRVARIVGKRLGFGAAPRRRIDRGLDA